MTAEMTQILKQTSHLSADDQLMLAALLIEQARRKAHPKRHSWLNVIGAASYPLVGEDAQVWVTRTRQEGDDEREHQWRQ